MGKTDILPEEERKRLRRKLEQLKREDEGLYRHIKELAKDYGNDMELALSRWEVWTRPAIFVGWDEKEGKWKEIKG